MIRIASLAALVLAVLAAASFRPLAQTNVDASALAKTVRLANGPTTLAELCSDISRQIGITVDPAEYLRERRFTAELEGLSARSALDAVCELNDWSLEQVRPGRYVVARRRLIVAADPSAMAKAMAAALPRDFRTFLRVEPPPGSGQARFESGLSMANTAMHMNRAQAALASSIKGDVKPDVDLPYRALSPNQKEELVTALTLRMFGFGSDWTAALWQGEGGFHLSEGRIYIEIPQGAGQGAGQILGVRAEDGKGGRVGFGANVATFGPGGP
jgi:hypothetical protein